MIRLRPNQTGDTIIEVLMSIAILAVVLATAFTSMNSSVHQGIDAGERDEALAYARQQAEYLKGAAAGNNLSQYKTNPYPPFTPFCIDQLQGPPKDDSSSTCKSYNGSRYSVKVVYNDNTAAANPKDVFLITVSWDRSKGPGQNQVSLSYRPGGS